MLHALSDGSRTAAPTSMYRSQQRARQVTSLLLMLLLGRVMHLSKQVSRTVWRGVSRRARTARPSPARLQELLQVRRLHLSPHLQRRAGRLRAAESSEFASVPVPSQRLGQAASGPTFGAATEHDDLL